MPVHLKRKMRVHQKDAEINTAFLLFNAVSPGDGLKANALAAGKKGSVRDQFWHKAWMSRC